MEIDHVFVLCDVGAVAEGEALSRFGLREWTANTHPGQGTACRRFLIADVHVELLWIEDDAEARREPAARTRLWDRWVDRRSGGCPFGLVFRPSIGDPDVRPPLERWWSYTPAYLPAGLSIEIAETPLDQPFVAYLPFARDRARPIDAPRLHVDAGRDADDGWRLRLTAAGQVLLDWRPTSTA